MLLVLDIVDGLDTLTITLLPTTICLLVIAISLVGNQRLISLL